MKMRKEVREHLVISVVATGLTLLFGWFMLSPESDKGDAWFGWLILTSITIYYALWAAWQTATWWRHLHKEEVIVANTPNRPPLTERLKVELTPAYMRAGKQLSV